MIDISIKEAIIQGSNILKNVSEDPRREARYILKSHLKCDDVSLILMEDEPLPFADIFFSLVKRRANYEPIQYITQEVSFYSNVFYIKKGVLIPRPETEILIDLAVKEIKNIKNPKILEIGTGSGIISVMLKMLRPDSVITATDISLIALENASENAKRFDVDIAFINTSYMNGINGFFDLIISNPPYISSAEVLDKSVMQEPHEALFGGTIGDEMLREIVLIAKSRSRILACEMGYDQKKRMEIFFKENSFTSYKFYKDLHEKDRGFIINF